MQSPMLLNPYHLRGGQDGYMTPCHPGASPMLSAGKKIKKWLLNSCLLGGSKVGKMAACSLGVPQRSAWGRKIRNGRLTSISSGGQKWATRLHNPCYLGGPQRLARGEIQKCVPNPCLFGGPKVGAMATSLLPSQGSHQRAQNGRSLTKKFRILKTPPPPWSVGKGTNQQWSRLGLGRVSKNWGVT